MLNKLFGSQARVKILKLFLLNPEKKYYIRQIARDLKLQVNSVRRELENLRKFGILIDQTKTIEISDLEKALLKENGLKLPTFTETKTVKTNSHDGFSNDSSVNNSINTLEVNSEHKIENNEINSELVEEVGKTENKQEKKYYQADKDFILFNELKSLIVKSQILSAIEFVDRLKKICQPQYLVLGGIFVGQESGIDIFIVGEIAKEELVKVMKTLEEEVGREVNFTVMDPDEFKYRREVTDVFLFNILEGKKIVVIDEIGKGKRK
ncbi:MAG: transcriptional regulator [Planctomycetes bacterium]|jgi:DNA-binding Lrp family transcriptional regulator|nr:transcriptional regulator [Planctomycetota bacterium]